MLLIYKKAWVILSTYFCSKEKCEKPSIVIWVHTYFGSKESCKKLFIIRDDGLKNQYTIFTKLASYHEYSIWCRVDARLEGLEHRVRKQGQQTFLNELLNTIKITIAYHGGDPIQLKRVNKVGVSGKPTSASNSNPLAVSALREIHSSWCLHRIRKALRPIA